MNNYTKQNFIKELADINTGEVKYYKEVQGFKRTAMSGWNMLYPNNLQKVLTELNGKMKIEIFFHIFKMFKKKKSEVQIHQDKLAKEFNTAQQYISKVIKILTDLEVLIEIRSSSKSAKWYRFNPYVMVPSGANAVDLQDEWDILINTPSKIKDKFEYLYYLQSDEWQDKSNECKRLANYKCIMCGSKDMLEVHHKTYDNLYNETQDDLECLCHCCHKRKHLDPSK
jgi:predicted transcriptional regulator